MKNKLLGLIVFVGILVLTGITGALSETDTQNAPASGNLIQGYRVLTIDDTTQDIDLVVYRGDYIKFQFNAGIGDPVLQVPALSVNQKLTLDLDRAPYFKMKTTGRFPFTLGRITGNIRVIEYKQPYYREVEATEAAEHLKNLKPLLLDVRTRSEYDNGHIRNALLIPVQELQRRVGELSEYQHSEILVYCATGNRSTVASKILIDNGFKRITNMRDGIYGWQKTRYPLTK